MKSFAWLIALPLCVFGLAACDSGPKSPLGFSLPDGNASAGEKSFVALHCNDCHTIVGKDSLRDGIDPVMTLPLGGKTIRLQTYGELVTAIINPSHTISRKFPGAPVSDGGRSKMRIYNDVMTVGQLIDLVAFLQAQYEIEQFEPTIYPPYGYPPGVY